MRAKLHTQSMTGNSVYKSTETTQSEFESLLQGIQTQENTLTFSKHANLRLQNRNIDLQEEQVNRLESGVDKAREKGIKESLVLMDDLAFVVSVKNSVVITVMGDTEERVFTNIDGAVIV